MKPFNLIFRPAYRSTLTPSRLPHASVSPPSLRHAPSSAWQRLMFWLVAPAPHDAAPPLNRLPGVQEEFQRALLGIEEAAAYAMACRISNARSLREMWHLRADIYTLIAQQYSEFEAAQRVALLNRHFPTRAPRSGFAPLAS